MRGKAARVLDQDDPIGAMTKHLLKVRRSDPKSYRMILASLGDRTKFSRLRVVHKSQLIKATKPHARIRQMRNTEGLKMLDEKVFCYHWKCRKGWKRKYAQKQFKKECKKEGSVAIAKNVVKKLGVGKPEEYNFDDIVHMKKREGLWSFGVVACGANERVGLRMWWNKCPLSPSIEECRESP